VIKTYELVESSTRGERKEFAAMLAFAQAQNETVAIVADAVDRFQRSFKESVLIDELIRKEKVKLHFHREGMIIGKGASSTDILRWDFSVDGRKVLCAEPLRKRAQKPRIQTPQRRVGREGTARLPEPAGRD
jgi:Resolvase, N terminal domain